MILGFSQNVIENKPQKTSGSTIAFRYETFFSLFMAGSVLGFIIEGLWHLIRSGTWESHSAVIWGPFCIIYGIGVIAVYLLSCCLCRKKLFSQFIVFSFAGAAVEYFSSLFQEICFGSTSWDYSNHILNIGGRVSLQMAIGWGILGIVFVRWIFPHLKRFLNKINGRLLKISCIILGIFMTINILVSVAAVSR